MGDNFTIHLHMIMSLLVLSGLQTVITSQLDHSKCSDFATELDGLIPLINLNAVQF
jgi:hypothetical protein